MFNLPPQSQYPAMLNKLAELEELNIKFRIVTGWTVEEYYKLILAGVVTAPERPQGMSDYEYITLFKKLHMK